MNRKVKKTFTARGASLPHDEGFRRKNRNQVNPRTTLPLKARPNTRLIQSEALRLLWVTARVPVEVGVSVPGVRCGVDETSPVPAREVPAGGYPEGWGEPVGPGVKSVSSGPTYPGIVAVAEPEAVLIKNEVGVAVRPPRLERVGVEGSRVSVGKRVGVGRRKKGVKEGRGVIVRVGVNVGVTVAGFGMIERISE